MAYEGNRYAGLNRRREDKASWLEPALTAAGAVVGSIVPGVGTAAGAAAGRALGSAGHSMANGGGAESLVMPGMQAFQTFRPSVPQTGISPQGGGTQPTLPTPDPSVPDFGGMDNRSILQMFMQNPSMFRRGYANGGLVTGPAMDLVASQWAEMDPVQRAMLQAQQAAGPAPTAPTPTPLQQAQHPTLEALSGLLPQIMAAMPRPANPRNTKAIGAWLPAAGLALSAPAAIAQSRRASANAPIEERNKLAQSDYEARRKAYEDRKTKIGDTLVGNATKPFAPRAEDGTTMVDIPGVGPVPATSRLAAEFLWSRDPSLRPKKPVTGVSTSTTISPRAKRIVEAIRTGKMRPNVVSSLPPRDPIRAEVVDGLASGGVDVNTMLYDITAETKYWQVQNDSKRTTIRTQLNTLAHTIPYTRTLIQQAKETIPDFSTAGFNKVTLAAAANLPGQRGVLARKLIAQIGDIGAEVGTLYMGGNSNTDESFRLAGQNIQADWSEEQLMGALDQIEMNTGIRLNAIKDVVPSKPSSNKPIKSVDDY